MDEDEV